MQTRKTSLACDACRRRKLSCRGEQPQSSTSSRCIRCTQADLLCTYNDARVRRGPKTGSRLRAIRAAQAAEKEASVSGSPSIFESESPISVTSDETSSATTAEIHPQRGFLPQAAAEVSTPADERLQQATNNEPSALAFELSLLDGLGFGSLGSLPLDCFGDSPEYSFEVNDTAQVVAPTTDALPSQQSIVLEISATFSVLYQRYPLWHVDSLVKKILNKSYLTDVDCRLELYSLLLLNDISNFRRSPSHGTTRLNRLVKLIEETRTRTPELHFATSPSLVAVVCSLVLFVAHSVCDRPNVAFFYLAEAIGLLRLINVDRLEPIEAARHRRLGALLYITEMAFPASYNSAAGMHKMAQCPDNLATLETSMVWYDSNYHPEGLPPEMSHLAGIAALDGHAVKLMCDMVRLYNAETAAEIVNIPMIDLDLVSVIEHGGLVNTSIQEADIHITREWQLSRRWEDMLAASGPNSSLYGRRCKETAGCMLQKMGLSALQKSHGFEPSEMRLIGHGKLAGMATAMFNVASKLGVLARCSSVIWDLILATSAADYERYFHADLSAVVSCIQEVPRQVTFSSGDRGNDVIEREEDCFLD